MADIVLGGTVSPGGAFEQARASDIKGGLHAVADVTARDAIPSYLREQGMAVWVISTSTTYRLVGGILNGNWAADAAANVNGATVPAGGSLTTGNSLQVSGANALTYGAVNLAGGVNYVTGVLPTANQASQAMAGDVTGTTAAAVVAKINGATVPAAGSLTTGNVPQVSGVSAITYGPVNLAGGTNYVTGVLPTANQASQTVAGDVTGTTAAAVVAKINGATVPAAGALTTGNVPQVSGVSAITYGPVNLAGGANYVTGTLPSGNQAAQTMAGDCVGTTAANTVTDLTISGETQGDVLVRGASTWTRLAAGAFGTALISNGAGATPSFSSQGWQTVYEVDFTTLANLNLKTGGDGTKVIDGRNWSFSGTADSTSADVVNGTGIVLVKPASVVGTQGPQLSTRIVNLCTTLTINPFDDDFSVEIKYTKSGQVGTDTESKSQVGTGLFDNASFSRQRTQFYHFGNGTGLQKGLSLWFNGTVTSIYSASADGTFRPNAKTTYRGSNSIHVDDGTGAAWPDNTNYDRVGFTPAMLGPNVGSLQSMNLAFKGSNVGVHIFNIADAPSTSSGAVTMTITNLRIRKRT